MSVELLRLVDWVGTGTKFNEFELRRWTKYHRFNSILNHSGRNFERSLKFIKFDPRKPGLWTLENMFCYQVILSQVSLKGLKACIWSVCLIHNGTIVWLNLNDMFILFLFEKCLLSIVGFPQKLQLCTSDSEIMEDL